jgi:hypothetical protein
MYSVVHTGPKIQFGGLKEGFLSPAYQPIISVLVSNPEITPTATQNPTQKISAAADDPKPDISCMEPPYPGIKTLARRTTQKPPILKSAII